MSVLNTAVLMEQAGSAGESNDTDTMFQAAVVVAYSAWRQSLQGKVNPGPFMDCVSRAIDANAETVERIEGETE